MPKASKTADAFAGAVEQALERIADPAWLGERSPLAAPYFLGAALDAGDALTAVGRGQALRRLLQSAAATLNPETREILDASFFKRKPTFNNAGIALSLNKSEATYYRNRWPPSTPWPARSTPRPPRRCAPSRPPALR
jgi:hypothetical protein